MADPRIGADVCRAHTDLFPLALPPEAQSGAAAAPEGNRAGDPRTSKSAPADGGTKARPSAEAAHRRAADAARSAARDAAAYLRDLMGGDPVTRTLTTRTTTEGGTRTEEAMLFEQRSPEGARMSFLGGTAATRPDVPGLPQMEAELHLLALHTRTDRALQLEGVLAQYSHSLIADANGTRVGLSANAAQLALKIGRFDPKNPNDEQLRIGVSAGPGVAIRLHHSDEDGDGRREWGVGLDLGPVTADVKTENPVYTLIPAKKYWDALVRAQGAAQ